MSKENAEAVYALFELHKTIANRMAEIGIDYQSAEDTEVIAKLATAVGMPCTAREIADAVSADVKEESEKVIRFR